MAILTREQRKQGFEHRMSMLEAYPEDSTHDIFMLLTQKEKRSIITIMSMDRAGIKDPKNTDSEGNIIAFDGGAFSKNINISRCTACLNANLGEEDKDFSILHIDPSYFEKFKVNAVHD